MVSDVTVGWRRDTGKPWRGPLLPRQISLRITIADAMAKAVMVRGGVGTATAPSQAPLVTVHTLPEMASLSSVTDFAECFLSGTR